MVEVLFGAMVSMPARGSVGQSISSRQKRQASLLMPTAGIGNCSSAFPHTSVATAGRATAARCLVGGMLRSRHRSVSEPKRFDSISGRHD